MFDKLRKFRYSDVKFGGILLENWLFERFKMFKLGGEPRLDGIFLENELCAIFMSLREASESNEFGTIPKNELISLSTQLIQVAYP